MTYTVEIMCDDGTSMIWPGSPWIPPQGYNVETVTNGKVVTYTIASGPSFQYFQDSVVCSVQAVRR